MYPIQRKEHEDFLEWKLRLIVAKLEHDIDLDWAELKEILGLSCHPDHLRKTAYGIYEFKKYFDKKLQEGLDDKLLKELELQKIELLKEKTRLQDQKREYMNLIRNQARFEHLREEIYKTILDVAKEKPLVWSKPKYDEVENKTGILLLSDWHVGSEFSNSFNSYNIDIFKSRVQTVVEKAIKDGKRNNIRKMVVANLGDALNGLIHISTRVMSGENVVRQIQIAAETLAEVICKLANEFQEVVFVNVKGNHSRSVSNKNDAIPVENFEYLIPWFLEARLAHVKNLDIVSDKDGYVLQNICNKNVVFVHGDLDHVQSCVKSLPQMLGILPHIVLMGHVHHNTLTEHGVTTVISSGSIMGSDDYAIAHRYFAKPSQKFIVLDENCDDEIIYTYNLK